MGRNVPRSSQWVSHSEEDTSILLDLPRRWSGRSSSSAIIRAALFYWTWIARRGFDLPHLTHLHTLSQRQHNIIPQDGRGERGDTLCRIDQYFPETKEWESCIDSNREPVRVARQVGRLNQENVCSPSHLKVERLIQFSYQEVCATAQ